MICRGLRYPPCSESRWQCRCAVSSVKTRVRAPGYWKASSVSSGHGRRRRHDGAPSLFSSAAPSERERDRKWHPSIRPRSDGRDAHTGHGPGPAADSRVHDMGTFAQPGPSGTAGYTNRHASTPSAAAGRQPALAVGHAYQSRHTGGRVWQSPSPSVTRPRRPSPRAPTPRRPNALPDVLLWPCPSAAKPAPPRRAPPDRTPNRPQ